MKEGISMHIRSRRTIRISWLLVAVAALALAAVIATGAGAAGGNRDVVTGGFEDRLGEHIGLSANSGPSGENPSGRESVTFTDPEAGNFKIRSRVTCLAVDGNLAAWGTVATDSSSNTVDPGTEFVEVGRDGGPGGAADGWDFIEAPAADCADFLAEAAAAPPIASGDISIFDAQP
jgi:hypothetical protein